MRKEGLWSLGLTGYNVGKRTCGNNEQPNCLASAKWMAEKLPQREEENIKE